MAIGETGGVTTLLNLIWLLLAGLWLALGIANFKMIPISMAPLGKEIVPTDRQLASTRG